jgi:hypothetical protein
MIQVKTEERLLSIGRSLGENQNSGGWFACCSASFAARFAAFVAWIFATCSGDFLRPRPAALILALDSTDIFFKHMKLKSIRPVKIISTLQMSITMFTSSQMPKMLILTTKKINSTPIVTVMIYAI